MPADHDHVCQDDVFEGLFRQLAPDLRSFLLYKFRDAERLDDIVQEAFVVLWKNCLKVAPSFAKSYLYKVAQNQFLKLLERDKVAERHLSLQVNSHTTEDPEFTLEHKELGSRLAKAIDQLPDGVREVFLMHRIDQKTYAEIAAVLELSVKAVEKRMHKALVELRKICYGI